ncbi:nucleotidyltransferase domain-containing protein [Luteipulveratus mongoliensis]|uniref:nucleotidyltransferase domain-containing protein n=1 Tax=Luteipulveratus mongoliensis TaxID=571913 RepID=UPI000697D6C8|nr:nucleotidyltransferase domain-containing protein [Luteipulveratus mongoliensis]
MQAIELARRVKRGWTAPVDVAFFSYEPMPDDGRRRDLPGSARRAVRQTQLRNVWHSIRGNDLETDAQTLATRREQTHPVSVEEPWQDLVDRAGSDGATPFPLSLEESVELARRVVNERFPDVVAAWLGGSVVRGNATATSDLDITVLLDGSPAPFRESLIEQGLPVELFVQTPASLTHYRTKDQQRRQPTMARLVAESVILVGGKRAEKLRAECAAEVAAGPRPLSQNEIDAQRYALTCLVDDLVGSVEPMERSVLAYEAWDASARLLLGLEGRWQGSGKGLQRALSDWHRDVDMIGDEDAHSRSEEYETAMVGHYLFMTLFGIGDAPAGVIQAADGVLSRCGGRLFEGYRLGGEAG